MSNNVSHKTRNPNNCFYSLKLIPVEIEFATGQKGPSHRSRESSQDPKGPHYRSRESDHRPKEPYHRPKGL